MTPRLADSDRRRLAVPCLRAALLLALVVAGAPARLVAQSLPPALLRPPAQPAAGDLAGLGADQVGEVDFGVRLHTIDDEVGRFQRFRDLRSGPTVERLRYSRQRETWRFDAQFDNVGYRDQRYAARFEQFGRLRGVFEWSQVPLFFGNVTRSPFVEETPGVFRLDNVIQAAVEDGTASIASYAPTVRAFDTRARRDTARLGLTYAITQALDLHVGLTSTGRRGEQPWGATFGLNNATEVPVPLQHRTTDVRTAAEWSTPRGTVRLAYDGSWFGNDVGTLIWDNPLRFTDRTIPGGNVSGDASAQGRMALWPDSTAHTISASGSVALPARSRGFAYVSVGSWMQDGQLLPHTINTAITPIPLPRDTAQAEARITSMSYRFTSRPHQMIWVSGQYRLYDYDNRTPHFPVTQYVRVDQTVGTSLTGGSHAFEYTRHFVDADVSFTPFRAAAFRVGYGQEHDNRTYRFFEETTDQTVRASVDSTGFAWGALRLQYDRSVRTGEGLDEQAFSDVGEQVSLRQFDISDRTRDRVTAIVQVLPLDMVGVSASVAVGRESRPDAAFGLQDNDLRAVTGDVDVALPRDVGLGASYGWERYSTVQQSRQATPGPQFNDPTRDWWTDMAEHVHTVAFHLDVPRVTERAALRVGYDFVGSRAQYVYRVREDTTLPIPQQLAPVRNRFHLASADVRYLLTRQLALAGGYRFDHYTVEDFAQSPGVLNNPLTPGFVNLLYQWRPYDAHTGSVRLIYAW